MYKMTHLIYDTLKKIENLKVFTHETEDSSNVWLKFSVENGQSYTIRFISNDDENDVAVRIFSLLYAEESQQAAVLPVLNRLNNRYRFVKFVLDEDGDINVEYDYAVNCPDPAASAKELVSRIVSIVNDSYPEILRALNS